MYRSPVEVEFLHHPRRIILDEDIAVRDQIPGRGNALFLVEQAADTGAEKAEAGRDWLLIEGAGDGYQKAGWLIRQSGPWCASALTSLINSLDVERKKGAFLTDRGWLAVNQEEWSAIAAPEDGHARLELIDSAALDAVRIDCTLRRLD